MSYERLHVCDSALASYLGEIWRPAVRKGHCFFSVVAEDEAGTSHFSGGRRSSRPYLAACTWCSCGSLVVFSPYGLCCASRCGVLVMSLWLALLWLALPVVLVVVVLFVMVVVCYRGAGSHDSWAPVN